MSELIRDIHKLEKLASHQLINQTSGNQEWGTPPEIIEAARLVMGSIDLDPASSIKAQDYIKAGNFWSKYGNGLAHDWFGNVWLNHPFGRKENYIWINKLMREWEEDHIYQACCICFASTSEQWFKPLKYYPQCYLDGRTNYIDLATGEQVKGVSKGSVVTYLGHKLDAFEEHFGKLGDVMWPTRFVDRKFFRSG